MHRIGGIAIAIKNVVEFSIVVVVKKVDNIMPVVSAYARVRDAQSRYRAANCLDRVW